MKPYSKYHCHREKDHRNKVENGTTYLYEDKSYWDYKEKEYSTHECTCIGKVGADGKPVYNKYYNSREEIQVLAAEVEKANVASSTIFVGKNLVLDKALTL